MKTFQALMAVALLPLLTACEGWQDFELDPYLPTVTFDNLEILDVNWEGVEADFVFNVNNPNPVDVIYDQTPKITPKHPNPGHKP